MSPETDRFARRLVAYEEQGDTEFVIPEDLSVLSDAELTALHEAAVASFDALYGDGSGPLAEDGSQGGGLTDSDLAALAELTAGIEALLAEVASRGAAAESRSEEAATLASRAHGQAMADETDENEDGETVTDEAPEDEDEEVTPVIAASGRREIRVNLRGLPRGYTPRPNSSAAPTMRDVVRASGDGGPFQAGTGVDWADIGKIVDRRLVGFNQSTYSNAQRAGQHMRQQFGVATIHKQFDSDLMVTSADRKHVDEVLHRAADQSRLPGGSLLAAGGWCAPSEIVYDLVETESRDGLFSVPEIGIARGGIQFTRGPSYAEIYAAVGFDGTEADDIAGNYVNSNDPLDVDANTAGNKPCYTVDCPDFEEVRLGYAGVCINAGLLMQRGYPEVLARTTRGALVAHDHKMSVRVIAAIAAQSSAVTMTPAQVGATAPLLDAIEKQVEHTRYVGRLARGTTLEAVFPYWIHGLVRSDLARRNGVDMLSVTDAQIDAWFTLRGISAQFVYDWQALTGTAASFVAWPTTVSFLLYVAGTWVKGTSDIITLDTIYDSVLLGQNNFTALFTEEGWLVAKRGFDSRVVTVALNPNGGTGAGVALDADGTILGVG